MGPVRLAAVVGLALLAAACASGGGSGDSGPRRDRNLITGEELTQTGELTTLFDAIRRLRPTWLRGRGNLSAKVFIVASYPSPPPTANRISTTVKLVSASPMMKPAATGTSVSPIQRLPFQRLRPMEAKQPRP